ncbi:Protein phosphatase methylesterase 1 [Erysiphe neolycopersici]|uniref:Protein phosphatase methylesterase 1 n=1 Tax=Erysiphe neolycopersici TaxID=212602 RepID=A0A420HHZ5_9PEZI|nr:Protein phosphatase methylesterase 1 [Erysiphe neolycopersici]
MSDFQRSFAKSKLGLFPPAFDELDEEETIEGNLEQQQQLGANLECQDDDSLSECSVTSTITIKPTYQSQNDSASSCNRPLGSEKKKRYTPLTWSSFFERELYIESEAESIKVTHHAYITLPKNEKSPLFVLHHGAGSSGLSFAQLAIEIRKKLPSAGILSIDARGHGFTHISPVPEVIDLSLNTLSEDLLFIINQTKTVFKWQEIPQLVLVGHSLGGAVITHLAKSAKLDGFLLCYAVIDVVEGSAMDALKSMQTYLLSRPTNFNSFESAIEWHIRSRTIRNPKSAQVSVPALLKQIGDSSDLWTWRTDLAATQPFWESWFLGMSKKFLGGRAGKLLLLAGTDRLDTELMIGQMQGRFALQIFPEAGHFIHEDQPEKVALITVDFYHRNDRSALVLPPKVNDMLRAGKKI